MKPDKKLHKEDRDMLLTTSEAAKCLQCSADNVRLLERAGRLPATKTSTGQRIFNSDDVERLAQERAQAKEQKAASAA
jgi:excisionase family DNA binding protein